MPTTPFTIHRTHSLAGGGQAMEGRTNAGQRITVWAGRPLFDAVGDHPGLAMPLWVGTHNDEEVWIESRPAPWCLLDIEEPLGETNALDLVCRIADALASLHAMGLHHGSLREDSIVVHSDGSPCLIGIGRRQATAAEDVQGTLELLQRLHPFDDLPDALTSASGLAAKLREMAIKREHSASDLAARLAAQGRPIATEEQQINVAAVRVGLSDEVQPELGSDTVGRGILDRWAPITDDGDLTEDPTETGARIQVEHHNHQQLLGRITDQLHRIRQELNDGFEPPGSHFRNHLLNETLDPLPVPNGLVHGPVHNPANSAEQTAELSVPESTNPSPIGFDDTTGNTEGESAIQPSVLTGLLWATVVGMLLAGVMLLAAWLIISGVF